MYFWPSQIEIFQKNKCIIGWCSGDVIDLGYDVNVVEIRPKHISLLCTSHNTLNQTIKSLWRSPYKRAPARDIGNQPFVVLQKPYKLHEQCSLWERANTHHTPCVGMCAWCGAWFGVHLALHMQGPSASTEHLIKNSHIYLEQPYKDTPPPPTHEDHLFQQTILSNYTLYIKNNHMKTCTITQG